MLQRLDLPHQLKEQIISASEQRLISIVIPTRNEAVEIDQALERLQCLPGVWEIIVADSGSHDGTAQIAARYPNVDLVASLRGRGAGMNAGAAQARGDLLLFLHADTRLPENAYALIANGLADRSVAATAFKLQMDRDEFRFRVLSLVSSLRIRIQHTFFGDQAIAVRRVDFERLGGCHELLLMEDVDLSRRLRKLGRLQILPASVTTSARRFERQGVLRTLLLMSCFQLAYNLGVSGNRLDHWYAQIRRHPNRAGTT